MKKSLIITVRNEENTIKRLLESILNQSVLPEEVIITDAQSSDTTQEIIQNYVSEFAKKDIVLTCFVTSGNRAEGRNEAIEKARSDIILITDAGCILDKHWIKEIISPFDDKSVAVVAGYYRGISESIFEKCIIPYFLVMPDKVDPKTFLPATRSMAMKKNIWQELGGFPEQYSRNEDYVFARELRTQKKKIVFTNKAIVHWMPPTNIPALFSMFCRHAFGDAESGIFRPKVLFILLRYILVLLLLILGVLLTNLLIIYGIIFMSLFYICWAAVKNYRYVPNKLSLIYFPIIQLLSDYAVIIGSMLGGFKFLISNRYMSL